MHRSEYEKKDFFMGYPKAEVFYDMLPDCPLNPEEYKGKKDCTICLGVGQVCIEDYSRSPSYILVLCTCVRE